jgi:hypothetical protein
MLINRFWLLTFIGKHKALPEIPRRIIFDLHKDIGEVGVRLLRRVHRGDSKFYLIPLKTLFLSKKNAYS